MPAKQIVLSLVTFLHDLFTATWIGGMLTLMLSVLPAAKSIFGKEIAQKLGQAIQKRLSIVTYVSMAGLALTGILLSQREPAFNGLFRFNSLYATLLSVKHICMAAMVLIALLRSIALPRFKQPGAQATRLSLVLLAANTVLGAGVLVVTGFLSALSSTPPTPMP